MKNLQNFNIQCKKWFRRQPYRFLSTRMITRKNFQDISICNAPSQMILKIFEFFFGRCRSPTYKYVVQGSAIELGRAPNRKLKPIF